MKQEQHTAGPWIVRKGHGLCFIEAPKAEGMVYALEVCGDDYTGYGDEVRREADMRRIVSCVNALEGLNPEAVREVIETLENAEFLLRKLSINPLEITAMRESVYNAAEIARSALDKVTKGE